MSALLDAIRTRTDEVVAALSMVGAGVVGPSLLSGWSRLTIACRLRYGAPGWLVVAGDHGAVDVREQGRGEAAGAVLRGSSRDLLAVLLGRPTLAPLGDEIVVADFTRAFPGP